MLENRLNTLEKEIHEIKKVVNQACYRLNTLEKEYQEIRNSAKEQDDKLDSSVIEQQQHVKLDFTCSLCSVNKPIDQRECHDDHSQSIQETERHLQYL